jgi:multidrug efflux pump subunit AcrA (membrane-fusion protein)
VGIQLDAAQAELRFRREELRQLENGSRPEEIRKAEADMHAAEAQAKFAAARYDRNKNLEGALSEDEIELYKSEAESAAAKYEAAKATWELAVEGPRDEEIDQARARFCQQEEEVRRIEDDLSEHTIVAPFDGYVTREYTEVGQWIDKGDPVVDLVEVQQVEVQVNVLESDISHIQINETRPEVEIAALPGARGKVVAVVPQADVRSRSFPVKVRVDNRFADGTEIPKDVSADDFDTRGVLFKPGMFARVTFRRESDQAELLVPKDALNLGGETPIVYVVDSTPDPEWGESRDTARMVVVELGPAVDGLIVVKGDLREGERVVVEGNERLRPGQKLRIIDTVESTPAPPSP